VVSSELLWGLFACGETAAPPLPGPELQIEVTGLVPRFAEAFREPARLQRLSRGLAGCVEEPRLTVRYAEGEGHVTLGGRWTGCLPPTSDLSPLVPAGEALAAYRDELALFEPRLATFGLQLVLGDCVLTLAGQIPPDGTTFSPCVARAGVSCPRSLQGVRVLPERALEGCR
jgi:hypothetical protein